MADRPYVLGLQGATWRGDAPDIRTAIRIAEEETGRTVWSGGSVDGGVPSFDSLQDFLDTHRGVA